MTAGWLQTKDMFLMLFGVSCLQVCFGQDWLVGPKFFNLDYTGDRCQEVCGASPKVGAQPQVSSAPALNFLHPVLCVGPLKGPATPPSERSRHSKPANISAARQLFWVPGTSLAPDLGGQERGLTFGQETLVGRPLDRKRGQTFWTGNVARPLDRTRGQTFGQETWADLWTGNEGRADLWTGNVGRLLDRKRGQTFGQETRAGQTFGQETWLGRPLDRKCGQTFGQLGNEGRPLDRKLGQADLWSFGRGLTLGQETWPGRPSPRPSPPLLKGRGTVRPLHISIQAGSSGCQGLAWHQSMHSLSCPSRPVMIEFGVSQHLKMTYGKIINP